MMRFRKVAKPDSILEALTLEFQVVFAVQMP